MHISDIRPHDMTGDFVVLSERRLAEAKASEKLQVTAEDRYIFFISVRVSEKDLSYLQTDAGLISFAF